ncbi:hypothetical protein E2562_024315 [Oryza meyeriana var. granulata]|uniref:Reverse transcriptase domain-containing protein n=1 Tax=Oryza meyeriana var. granulata TaxID=110450 RepID=A0A6G1C8T8_9ORYZ|nr:hypothetical protein E2562_024315 [Oryza meyeriana var. granulata]
MWWIQGFSFRSDVRILPLGCYDVILGMDWLERHSPMQIDWVKLSKCSKLSYLGHVIGEGGAPAAATPAARCFTAARSGELRSLDEAVHSRLDGRFEQPRSAPIYMLGDTQES